MISEAWGVQPQHSQGHVHVVFEYQLRRVMDHPASASRVATSVEKSQVHFPCLVRWVELDRDSYVVYHLDDNDSFRIPRSWPHEPNVRFAVGLGVPDTHRAVGLGDGEGDGLGVRY